MPSPTSETAMPLQRTRKSRCRSGARSRARSKPPGRSSASWLCCIARRVEVGVGPFRPACEERGEVRAGHRTGEQEALADLAAEVVQGALLLRELDALGDDVEVEAHAERDDRRLQRDVLAGTD